MKALVSVTKGNYTKIILYVFRLLVICNFQDTRIDLENIYKVIRKSELIRKNKKY